MLLLLPPLAAENVFHRRTANNQFVYKPTIALVFL